MHFPRTEYRLTVYRLGLTFGVMVFFRSCRGGSGAVALERPLFGYRATRKTPRREYLTANETENQLSTNYVDKRSFKSLKRSRYGASRQIEQKPTNLLIFTLLI